jgi:exopolysaccharide production protein ExoQ
VGLDGRGWLRRNWVTLCGLALFVGSDYKFRTRSTEDSISGRPDAFILIELGLYGAIALYIVLVWAKPPRATRVPFPLLSAGFYLGLLALSVTYTPYPTFGGVRVGEMLILGALTWVIAYHATRADLHRFAHGFLLLVAASVLSGVARPSPPVSTQQIGRFTWLAIHPAVAGVFVGIAAVLAFVYLTMRFERPGPRWPSWLYFVLLAIVTWGLIATRTRSAVLGAIAGLFATQWAYRRGQRKLELLAALILGFVAVYLTAWGSIGVYFARGESAAQLGSLNSRTDLWRVAYEAIVVQPTFGYGTGASQGIFQAKIGLGGGHNAVINVTVDLGLVGLTVWLAMVIALIFGLIRLPTTRSGGFAIDRVMLIAIFTLIQVNGFFFAGPGAVSNVAATWTFISIGWLIVVQRTRPPAPLPAIQPEIAWAGLEPLTQRNQVFFVPPVPLDEVERAEAGLARAELAGAEVSAAPPTVPIAFRVPPTSTSPPTVPIKLRSQPGKPTRPPQDGPDPTENEGR